MSILSNYECEGQMSMFDLYGQDFSYGRMYQVPYQVPEKQTEGQTLGAYSKKFAELRIKMPQFLCLTGGAWSTSGCIMGDGYSVAWRVHDSQFWGVPQRRKRIALVADFGGSSAPEILFERKSVSGDITESREQGQDTPGAAIPSPVKAISFQERAGCEGGARESSSKENEQESCQPLTTNRCLNSWDVQSKHIQPQDGIAECLYSGEKSYGGGQSYVMQEKKVYGISGYDSNAMKSPNPNSGIYEADTTRTLDLNGGNPACNQGGMVVLEGNGSRPSHQGDGYKESEISYTLNGTEQHAVCWDGSQVSPTLTANNAGGGAADAGQRQLQCGDNLRYRQSIIQPGQERTVRLSSTRGDSTDDRCKGTGGSANPQIVGALCMSDYKGVGSQYVADGKVIIQSL